LQRNSCKLVAHLAMLAGHVASRFRGRPSAACTRTHVATYSGAGGRSGVACARTYPIVGGRSSAARVGTARAKGCTTASTQVATLPQPWGGAPTGAVVDGVVQVEEHREGKQGDGASLCMVTACMT
jgi:hypothetical protein